ncbi:RICIN domain-containing protein [Actinokineospora sp. NPDC004072]
MSLRTVTASLGTGLLLLGLGPVAAAEQGESVLSQQLRNVATGFCLDSNTSGNVYTLGCNGGNFQQWNINFGEVRNVATGLCLDSNTNGNVYTLGCNGGNFQRWSISGGEFRNVATGFCLDSNTSGNVYTLRCNGGNFQRWR